MHPGFAKTPDPPYYAVIFTSTRTAGDHGYAAMADAGNLGAESARGADGLGMTVSYWADEAAIRAWKSEARHAAGQWTGMTRWYEHYEVRIAKVERAYSGPEGRAKP
jgi:heme-degrading monooxygenase HmoA